MTPRHPLDPQFDLFVPFIADLPLRDQRETMERPFFSLAKRKRLKPLRVIELPLLDEAVSALSGSLRQP